MLEKYYKLIAEFLAKLLGVKATESETYIEVGGRWKVIFSGRGLATLVILIIVLLILFVLLFQWSPGGEREGVMLLEATKTPTPYSRVVGWES